MAPVAGAPVAVRGDPRRDASGALVAVPSRPVRIVSLVPSLTELLFTLGLGDRVAGVTVF